MQELDTMFDALERDGGIFQPSKFWRHFNEINVKQLEASGIENVKRTLARNYFTWVVGWRDAQFRAVARQVNPLDWPKVFIGLPRYDPDTGLTRRQFVQYVVFTRMMHLNALRVDTLKLLQRVSEPAFGNPFPVKYRGNLISQDLINSILELYAAFDGRSIDFTAPLRICEIGGGYGRNAYVFLKLFPNCSYTMVDIPPALYVSQSYIANVCPDRTIQKFGETVPGADVKFLLPQEAAVLPDDSFDLVVNISSFHEMKSDQVDAYFEMIDRTLSGRFFTKQWKSWHNDIDDIRVAEADYPIRPSWKQVYTRTSATQPAFFESVYDV